MATFLLLYFIWGGSGLLGQNVDSLREMYASRESRQDQSLAFELAEAFLKVGEVDSARKYCPGFTKEKLPKNDTDRARALSIMAEILEKELQFEKADSVLKLAQETADTDLQLLAITLKRAVLNHRSDHYDRLYDILKPIEQLVLKIGTSSQKVTYYNAMSFYYGAKNDIQNELDCLLKAKEITSIGEPEDYLKSNLNLSRAYTNLRAYEDAKRLGFENLELALKHEINHHALYAYYGIAYSALMLKQYELTKKYAFEAIEFSRQKKVFRALGFAYALLGEVYLEEGKIDSAAYYNELGLEISIRQKETKELGDNQVVKGDILLETGDDKGARQAFLEAEENRDFLEFEKRGFVGSSYVKEGRYKEAFKVYESLLEDYIRAEEENSVYQMASILLKGQNEQKRQLLVSQEEEKAQNQKFQLSLLGILLIVLIASVISLLQNRNSKKLELVNKELLKKNEELYHFTYICSHDLKEPIRNVSTFSHMVQRKLKDQGLHHKYEEYFDYVFRGVNTLGTIVNSLKAFSEIEGSNQQWLEKEMVYPKEVFDEAYSNLEVFIRENGAEVSFVNKAYLKKVKTSRQGLMLILQNLIHNAIKYNKSEIPTVQVSLDIENHCPVFRVSDNGIGIDKKYFEYIFKPFKTLDNKSKTNSSGLGLSICKKIITELGGKLLAEEGNDGGTTFVIILDKILTREKDLMI